MPDRLTVELTAFEVRELRHSRVPATLTAKLEASERSQLGYSRVNDPWMKGSIHDIIKTGDPDAYPAIQDGNGEVVLNECRVCGQAEGTLEAYCPGEKRPESPGEHVKRVVAEARERLDQPEPTLNERRAASVAQREHARALQGTSLAKDVCDAHLEGEDTLSDEQLDRMKPAKDVLPQSVLDQFGPGKTAQPVVEDADRPRLGKQLRRLLKVIGYPGRVEAVRAGLGEQWTVSFRHWPDVQGVGETRELALTDAGHRLWTAIATYEYSLPRTAAPNERNEVMVYPINPKVRPKPMTKQDVAYSFCRTLSHEELIDYTVEVLMGIPDPDTTVVVNINEERIASELVQYGEAEVCTPRSHWADKQPEYTEDERFEWRISASEFLVLQAYLQMDGSIEYRFDRRLAADDEERRKPPRKLKGTYSTVERAVEVARRWLKRKGLRI